MNISGWAKTMGNNSKKASITAFTVVAHITSLVCVVGGFISFFELLQINTGVSLKWMAVLIMIWALMSIGLSLLVLMEDTNWSLSPPTKTPSAMSLCCKLESESIHYITMRSIAVLIIFFRYYTKWSDSLLDNTDNDHTSGTSPNYSYVISLRFTILLLFFLSCGSSIMTYQRARVCHNHKCSKS
jgi:hypothetical protein